MRTLPLHPGGRVAGCVEFQALEPQYGETFLIKPEGLDYRLPAHFVGMEPRSYIIVRLSTLGVDAGQVRPFLEKDRPLKLFVTCEDALVGYLSQSLAYNAVPYRHLYIAWPRQGEAFTLRQGDRFECHLPARVEIPGLTLSGMLLDVSGCGCRACLDLPGDAEASDLPREGALVELTFSLLSSAKGNSALCEVRGIGRVKGKLLLGLRFLDLGQREKARLEAFLAFLERYRPPSQNARR